MDEARQDELAAREARLLERESELARAEARLRASVEAQKELIRSREREVEQERERRRELAAEHARRLGELAERERTLDRRDHTVSRWLRDLEAAGVDGLDDQTLTERIATLHAQLRLSAAADEEAPVDAAEAAELTERERELEARERELAARERAVAEREETIEQRVAAVTQRELALARRAAEAPPRAPEEDAPSPQAERPGIWNLHELERRVPVASGERRDELISTLAALREYADYEGNLPAAFDGLVADVFGELAGSRDT